MFLENLRKYNIILASQSPRRHELLAGLDIDFEVLVKEGIEEITPDGLTREQIPLYLAELKLSAYDDELKHNSLIITADTIVWLGGEALGKPSSADDAFAMIRKISGHTHTVITGVCLQSIDRKVSFTDESDVSFAELSDDEIWYYVNKYKPFDKAGAYGIQEWIGYIGIENIKGSYYNVMGLPVQRVYAELRKF